MREKHGLDATDIRILSAVQAHGQLSKTQLARIVNLSPTPCWERLTRLKAAGFIRGYRADIALDRIADFTRVVVTVSLAQHRKADFDRFEAAIRAREEITRCIATGGGMDYVMTVIAPSLAAFQELMDALDTAIPEPERDTEKPFLMPVEDIFTITGRGTVATGRIERGIVKPQEEVELVGLSAAPGTKTVVTGVEMFRKLLDEGRAGDNVGLLLRGVKKEEVDRGMVLAKPGSITPHTKFKAEVYVLTKEEGGRHTPFFDGYRPQFYFRTTDVTGSAHLPDGVEMVMPGDNVQMEVELISPIAMEKELRFAIREGGRTVGAGVVTDIID